MLQSLALLLVSFALLGTAHAEKVKTPQQAKQEVKTPRQEELKHKEFIALQLPEGHEAEVRERDHKRLNPEAPQFWTQFRSYAYRQLPKHQQQNFRAVWIAMPLKTSDGTVPTVGLKGSWW